MKSVSLLFIVALLSLCFMPSVSAKGVVGLPLGIQPLGVSSPDAKSMVPDDKVYDYTFDKDIIAGLVQYSCEMDLYVAISRNPIVVSGKIMIITYKNGFPQLWFIILAYDRKLAALCNKCRKNGQGVLALDDLKASLTLSNGEVLSFNKTSILDVRADDYIGSTNFGGASFMLSFNCDASPLSSMTDNQKIGYISQQLRTYNIKKFQMENFSVNFDEFPTAATISSMFDTLAEKTGNDLFHYNETTTKKSGGNYMVLDSAAVVTPAKATISSITTEHNVYKDGKKGMNVVVNFTVSGMKGKTGLAAAYFYYKSGEALKDLNKAYCTPDGKVSAPAQYTSPYDASKFTGLKIFIPLDELHMDSGHHELKANVFIFDENDRSISSGSGWTYFTFTK